MLSRLIYGARNTIGIAFVTTMLSFLLGGALGILASVLRGWVDQVLGRFVDVLMAIPQLIFALVLLSIVGSSVVNLILIMAVLDSTRVFRLSRAVAHERRGHGLRRGGAPAGREDRLDHVARDPAQYPAAAGGRVRPAVLFRVPDLSALSFLGVGIQPPTADWGSMVRENATLIAYGDITPLLPAGAIALLTVAVNFVVDWFIHKTSGLRDERLTSKH